MISKQVEIIANILFWLLTGTLISHGYGAYSQTSTDLPDSVTVVRNWDTFRQLISVVLFSAVCFYAIIYDFRKLKKTEDFLQFLIRSLLYLLGSILLFLVFKAHFLGGVKTVIPHFTYTGIFAFYFIVAHAYGFGNKLVRSEREQRTRSEGTRLNSSHPPRSRMPSSAWKKKKKPKKIELQQHKQQTPQ